MSKLKVCPGCIRKTLRYPDIMKLIYPELLCCDSCIQNAITGNKLNPKTRRDNMCEIDLKQIMHKIQELDDLLEDNCLYRDNAIEIRDYSSAEFPFPIELSISPKSEDEE